MTDPGIRSILVATDLGEGAGGVLEQAATLADHVDADLHVLHVLETPGRLPDALGGARAPAGDPDGVRAAAGELRERLGRILPDTAPASSDVRSGTAHQEIRSHAAEVTADLVVLGPNRDPDVRARFLGTTAERVLRGAAVPCLVVRAPLPLPPERIGVPTDLSEAGREALSLGLRWAAGLAGAAGAGGAGGSNAPRPDVRVMHAGWTVYRDDEEATRRLLVEPMEGQIADALESTGTGDRVSARSEIVWDNRSADAIVAWSERERLHLLVMGSEGRGGVKRALLGSVVTSVARRAPCSILVAPSPDEEREPA